MTGMTQQELLRRTAEIHDTWAPTARVVVDPRYAKPVGVPSQYAEGIEAVSAIPEDDAVAIRAYNELLFEYYTSNDMPVPEWLQRYMAKQEEA